MLSSTGPHEVMNSIFNLELIERKKHALKIAKILERLEENDCKKFSEMYYKLIQRVCSQTFCKLLSNIHRASGPPNALLA